MDGRRVLRVLLAVLAVAATARLVRPDCRADTIENIVKNNKGVLTSGVFTFTFTDTSVSSDPATPPKNASFTPPTAATVEVTTVPGGLTFTFNPFLDAKSPDPYTQNIFIKYSVKVTGGFTAAGLSFSGLAVDVNTKSEVTETFDGRNELLDVFKAKDNDGALTGQNDQTVALGGLPTTLDVTDQGVLSMGVRGNGEKSTAQLSDITNRFSVPEPASVVALSTGVILVLSAWCRNVSRGNAATPAH